VASGNCTNTLAITHPKIASTIHRANNRSTRNSSRTRGLSSFPATSPMVMPRLRRLTTSTAMSCIPPTRIEPTSTQITAGTQPHMIARAGPTIGPVPAMLVK